MGEAARGNVNVRIHDWQAASSRSQTQSFASSSGGRVLYSALWPAGSMDTGVEEAELTPSPSPAEASIESASEVTVNEAVTASSKEEDDPVVEGAPSVGEGLDAAGPAVKGVEAMPNDSQNGDEKEDVMAAHQEDDWEDLLGNGELLKKVARTLV